MEWARLYLDHRYLQMMCAQYIPSLWFITTIPNDGFLIKDRSTRLMKTLMTWRTSFFFVRAPPIFFAEIFFLKETFGERGKSCSFDKNKSSGLGYPVLLPNRYRWAVHKWSSLNLTSMG